MRYDIITDPDNDKQIMCITATPDWVSDTLRQELTTALQRRNASLNAWATEQLRQGREVMEHVIGTDEKRMRPLQPEDV